MSLARDQEYDRQARIREAQEALDFVVGATVYRHNHRRTGIIEEGVVRRVSRASIPPNGSAYEDPKGIYPYYIAEFPCPPYQSDWERQTYAWKFWATKAGAEADLVEWIDRWLYDENERHEREVRELTELRARLTPSASR